MSTTTTTPGHSPSNGAADLDPLDAGEKNIRSSQRLSLSTNPLDPKPKPTTTQSTT